MRERKDMAISRRQFVKGAAGITSTVFAATCVGGPVAESYRGRINTALGIDTTSVQSNASSSDTAYYKSDYGTDIYDGAALQKLEDDCAAAAVEEVEGGVVLLKNENSALPLAKGASVTLFGQNSFENPNADTSSMGFGYTGPTYGPFYSYHTPSDTSTVKWVTYRSAMENVFDVNATVADTYATSGYGRVKDAENPDVGEAPLSLLTDDVRSSWATQYNDAAIYMITRQGSEDCDLVLEDSEGISQLALHQNEKDHLALLQAEKAAGTFKKIVVLVNSSWAVELGELDSYDVDAILWVGTPGVVGFTGVANVLDGEANPSGKLVDTYAKNSLSAPAITYAQAKNTQKWANLDEVLATCNDTDKFIQSYLIYAEGIYVGYKYYETRYEDAILGQGNATSAAGSSTGKSWSYTDEIAYPFGYGLSYTAFDQTLDSCSYDAGTDTYTLSVTVTNVGDVAGRSVVEVYGQSPYGDYEKKNGIEKSAVVLVGFAKTSKLEPGAAETVTITVERYLLASYDRNAAKGYILSEGTYYLAIGDDAHDALNNILAAKGASGMVSVTGESTDGDDSKVYAWDQPNVDTTSYATSRYVDGKQVTNCFDEADLNNLGTDTVTYLSRSDWDGTFPTEPVAVHATEDMMKVLDGNFYEPPADAPSVASFTQGEDSGITFVAMRDVDYDDEETWNTFLNQLTVEEMASILPDQNGAAAIDSITMPASYRGDDMDQLQQVVFKFNGESGFNWPCAIVEASTWDIDHMAKRSSLTGNESIFMGLTEIWSGGPNIHRTPFNGRASAYYSEDGNMDYLIGEVVSRECQKYGVILGYKHMCLNDQEANRESAATFANEQAIREECLRAFEGAYAKGGCLGCMTAFNRIGVTYAGSCSATMNDVMRGEWGFKGVICSDACVGSDYKTHYATNMANGLDYWCWDMAGFGPGGPGAGAAADVKLSKDVIAEDIENGDGYMLKCLRDATKHTVYAQVRTSNINGLDGSSQIVHTNAWWENALTGTKIVTGVLTAGLVGLYAYDTARAHKKTDNESKKGAEA